MLVHKFWGALYYTCEIDHISPPLNHRGAFKINKGHFKYYIAPRGGAYKICNYLFFLMLEMFYRGGV